MCPIKRIPPGCISQHMKHVVSSEGNIKEFNLVLRFRVDDFNRIIDASSQRMKCFGCGMEGHLIPTCQQKQMRHIVVRLQHQVQNKKTDAVHSVKMSAQQTQSDGSRAGGSGAVGPVFDGRGADDLGSLDSGAAGLDSTGFGAVVEVIDQSHTDCINRDTVDTQTETKEAECSLEEEGEMLVDEDSFNDSKKRKANSLLVK